MELSNLEMQTQLLASQLRTANQPGNPPAVSVLQGQGLREPLQVYGSIPRQGAVEYKAVEIPSHDPGNPSRQAGQRPAMQTFNIGGYPVDLPSQQLAESLEGMPGGPIAATTLHNLGLVLRGRDKPSDGLLPKGYKWEWSVLRQSWRAVRQR